MKLHITIAETKFITVFIIIAVLSKGSSSSRLNNLQRAFNASRHVFIEALCMLPCTPTSGKLLLTVVDPGQYLLGVLNGGYQMLS